MVQIASIGVARYRRTGPWPNPTTRTSRRSSRRARPGRARASVRARDRDRGARHRREQGRLRRADRERTCLLPGIADRSAADRGGAVRRAAPPLPDHEARGGGSQRRRLAPAAPRRRGDEAGGGGLGRASRGRGRRGHRHVTPRLRGVRRSRGRRWPDPRERARLRPGVPPVRRTAGGPAGRGAGREARARPEGWAWPRGALPPRARTRSVGDGGGALPGGSERVRNGATARAVWGVRGTRAGHRRARARLAPGARPPRVPSAADRVDWGHRRGHGGRARSREAAHRPLDGRARQAGEGRSRGRGAARHREGARPVEREAEPRNAGRSAREVAEVEALSIREGSADVRARGDRISRRHGGLFSHRPFVLTGARRGTRNPRGAYAPRGGFAMTARRMLATVALTLLAAGVVASTARAVLPCNRKNCMEEILACEAAAGCDDLSGAAKSACRKQCLQQVLAACEADDTLCVPTTTSTTSTTLPCTPGTRPC